MKLSLKSLLTIPLAAFALAACGSGNVQTNPGNNNNNPPGSAGAKTTADSFAKAVTTLNAFSLGGDFPPDIQIPDISGMDSTAFVVNFSPAGVVPIDLTANPLKVSDKFPTFDASAIAEAAFPSHLLILSPTQAFLLGSGGVVYFNPSTGAPVDKVDLSAPINLTQALPYSRTGQCPTDSSPKNSAGPGSFSPSFAADLAAVGQRLFVSMSNACFDPSSLYVQGLVLVFDIHSQAPFLTPASTPFIPLNGFNATGLTVANGKVLATSTGDTDLVNGNSVPETDSKLDEIDPQSLQITRSLDLGLVAANFQPLAITGDGKTGFVGSSAFSQVYEIDLQNFSAVRGKNNPIVLSDAGDDFITDQKIAFGEDVLFVSSFNRSAVNGIDLTTADRHVLANALDFQFPGNPATTGAGPMALRPGEPSVDFTGPDLFLLTSSPGTVSNATTY